MLDCNKSADVAVTVTPAADAGTTGLESNNRTQAPVGHAGKIRLGGGYRLPRRATETDAAFRSAA
jgi:hypothetical protein